MLQARDRIYRVRQPGDSDMKIAVVGSRDFNRPDAVRQFVWEQDRTTVIVSGGAAGVDSVAVGEAQRLGMPYEVHLPDWSRYGRRAGAVRNQQIVDAAHEVVAFWDGQSRGTKITMDMARAAGKRLRVWSLESATLVDAVDPVNRGTTDRPRAHDPLSSLTAERQEGQ